MLSFYTELWFVNAVKVLVDWTSEVNAISSIIYSDSIHLGMDQKSDTTVEPSWTRDMVMTDLTYVHWNDPSARQLCGTGFIWCAFSIVHHVCILGCQLVSHNQQNLYMAVGSSCELIGKLTDSQTGRFSFRVFCFCFSKNWDPVWRLWDLKSLG